MKDKTSIPLTAGEMSALWAQYINDSVSICVTSHFLKKVEDEEVRPVIELALTSSKQNISYLTELLKKEHFPLPVGFTKEDVHVDAPKLYSDTFVLMYLRHMSVLGMAAGGVALSVVTRPDVVTGFKSVLKEAVMLQDATRELMLKQGTYVRPPFISVPEKVDFVKKQNFLGSIFGSDRPLTSQEITVLFNNIRTNTVGKTLLVGFGQTAKTKEVKEYFLKGKEMAGKHFSMFRDILEKEDLPAPMIWDSAVTDSTTPVFSEKLMMFHTSAMIAAGIGNYGASISGSPRKDLGAKYASLIPEVALYAEDGANIMIKHGWLEEPPQTDNRDRLIKE
ncbi:hypothetical protein CN918_28245 [Priestia megaterium]|nr:hypothetical protein CN918_28245 [Priestia megaterium]